MSHETPEPPLTAMQQQLLNDMAASPPAADTGPKCINCGMMGDGGFEFSEDHITSIDAGPFCSTCYEGIKELVLKQFPPAAETGREALIEELGQVATKWRGLADEMAGGPATFVKIENEYRNGKIRALRYCAEELQELLRRQPVSPPAPKA